MFFQICYAQTHTINAIHQARYHLRYQVRFHVRYHARYKVTQSSFWAPLCCTKREPISIGSEDSGNLYQNVLSRWRKNTQIQIINLILQAR